MFHAFLFYFFAFVLTCAAIGVIFARNPVHAVMFLVLAFFQSAVLWLLAEAEFLALVLVLVYVGAVMVLFLFVVMMLDIDVERVKGGFTRYAPFGLLVAVLMVVELVQVIWLRGQEGASVMGFVATPEGYSNTKALGRLLYTEYVYAFEIAAVILLVAIVGAIALTLRKRKEDLTQKIMRQLTYARYDTGLPTILTSNLPPEAILNPKIRPRDLPFTANHVFGSCRMSTDPGRGAVDPRGKVYGVKDLYICDTSIFPSGSAVNPQATVMALADVITRRLADLRA